MLVCINIFWGKATSTDYALSIAHGEAIAPQRGTIINHENSKFFRNVMYVKNPLGYDMCDIFFGIFQYEDVEEFNPSSTDYDGR